MSKWSKYGRRELEMSIESIMEHAVGEMYVKQGENGAGAVSMEGWLIN